MTATTGVIGLGALGEPIAGLLATIQPGAILAIGSTLGPGPAVLKEVFKQGLANSGALRYATPSNGVHQSRATNHASVRGQVLKYQFA
jgi:hypothetical protein